MSAQKQRRTFISYSRINKEFALKLALELRSSGFDIWFDQLDIPTGSRWDDEVEQALDECEIFMVILTPASSTSSNVKDEIGFAIDSGKRILPILLENANVPLRLRRFQYVDFTKKNFDEGVEGAKQLLRRLIEEPTIPRDQSVVTTTQTQVTRGDQPVTETKETEQLAARKAEEERQAREEAERVAKLNAEKEKSEIEAQKLKQVQTEAQLPKPSPSPVPQKMEAPVAPTRKKSRMPLILGVGGLVVVAVIVFAVIMMSGGSIPTTGSEDTNLSAASPASVMVEAMPTDTEAAEPTSAPTEEAAQPTNTIEPTAVPDSPTPGIQKFFTEEFDGDLNSWPIFIVDAKRDPNQPVITNEQFSEVNVSAKDSLYLFDIQRRQTSVYAIYDPFEYDDVRLDVRIDSRNINASTERLFCRYSREGGWYEFRIANNGLYSIFFAKPNASGLITYRTLANGASDKVKAGNAVNEYAITCQGNEFSLYINSELVKKTSDDLSILRTGKIGVSVASENSLPVLVGVDWVKISEP